MPFKRNLIQIQSHLPSLFIRFVPVLENPTSLTRNHVSGIPCNLILMCVGERIRSRQTTNAFNSDLFSPIVTNYLCLAHCRQAAFFTNSQPHDIYNCDVCVFFAHVLYRDSNWLNICLTLSTFVVWHTHTHELTNTSVSSHDSYRQPVI